jgi:hypothetical protein
MVVVGRAGAFFVCSLQTHFSRAPPTAHQCRSPASCQLNLLASRITPICLSPSLRFLSKRFAVFFTAEPVATVPIAASDAPTNCRGLLVVAHVCSGFASVLCRRFLHRPNCSFASIFHRPDFVQSEARFDVDARPTLFTTVLSAPASHMQASRSRQ